MQPHACGAPALVRTNVPPHYKRRNFRWREGMHPFAQKHPTTSISSSVFRSPTEGGLLGIVAHHVVRGRVIFPGAGYVEMARASSTTIAVALCDVFFLQPFEVDFPALLLECTISVDSRNFTICSGVLVHNPAALDEVTVHSSGELEGGCHYHRKGEQFLLARCPTCTRAVEIGSLYDNYFAVGLQYGPEYRTLKNGWATVQAAVVRLRARAARHGTVVHPADLDDALCATMLLERREFGTMPQLPFAVELVRLTQGLTSQWAVRSTTD